MTERRHNAPYHTIPYHTACCLLAAIVTSSSHHRRAMILRTVPASRRSAAANASHRTASPHRPRHRSSLSLPVTRVVPRCGAHSSFSCVRLAAVHARTRLSTIGMFHCSRRACAAAPLVWPRLPIASSRPSRPATRVVYICRYYDPIKLPSVVLFDMIHIHLANYICT